MRSAARQKLEGADPVQLSVLTGLCWDGRTFDTETLGIPIRISWPECQISPALEMWHDLHLRLLRSPKFPYYSAAYYKVLPFIVELRAKGGDKDVPELETCFDAMYGVLMLKLQKKEISEETMKAVKAISDLLAMLAGYYIKDKEGDLELD